VKHVEPDRVAAGPSRVVLFTWLEFLVLFLPLVLAVALRLRGSSRETDPTSSCSRWQSAT
jgi:hypothetical protein